MKLSVVVPIYKVERYLRKCVDSILCQDIPAEEYEIILVDDGSPDGCGAMADEYASLFSNVKVIHQENKGLGAARNAGIDAATGKYIQFVDSDDFLESNVLGGLVAKMDADNLDVIRFNYQNVNEQYEVYEPYKDVKPFVDLRDEICDGLTFLNERLGYACYAVQFMIRTDLLKSNGLTFKTGVYFEDTEWTPRMLCQVGRITSNPTIVYNYLLRTDSITSAVSSDRKEKILKDKLALIDSLKVQADNVSERKWFDGMISGTVVSFLSLVSTDFYSIRNKYLRMIRAKDVRPLSIYHATPKGARKIRLANHSMSLYCIVYHIKNSR